jgi:N,N'-diacetylchitobiose transport system permease protein
VAALSTPTRPPAAVPPEAAPRRRRARDRWLPYGLLVPSLLVLGAVLGYPLVHLVVVSLQKYRLRELIHGGGTYIGLDNYRAVLGDPFFWTVVLRTFAFTAVAVAATVLLSTAVAQLMLRMRRATRIILQSVLVMVWAMPSLVAIAVWQWLFDFDFGIVNWGLTRLGFSSFTRHNWFADPLQGFAVILGLVVWAAIPFVAITLYAAFTQVPRELEEAARVDGAGGWRVFRHVTFPVVRPLYVIVTSLSIIWDFGVYQQVYVMLNGRPSKDYYLVGIYSFVESFGVNDYGKGSAIAVVMIFLLLAACVVYIRQMIRLGDVR